MDSVNSKASKGRSAAGNNSDNEGGAGVMADRVKLSRPSGNSANNQYAAANEVPTGMHDKQKKKCC